MLLPFHELGSANCNNYIMLRQQYHSSLSWLSTVLLRMQSVQLTCHWQSSKSHQFTGLFLGEVTLRGSK